MNNAKVRIYELSKELNLDNKDIIEICEQLNIAVKSHSSTITEDQAERIKITAEKYVANQDRTNISDREKGERKQQILAIHHKQNRPYTQNESRGGTSTPVLVAPPKPPQSSAPSPSPKLNSPPDTKEPKLKTSPQSPKSPQTVGSKPKIYEKPSESSVSAPLLNPPVRSTQKAESDEMSRPVIASKPSLKGTSDLPEPTIKGKAPKKRDNKAPSLEKEDSSEKRKPKRSDKTEKSDIPELKRPVPPKVELAKSPLKLDDDLEEPDTDDTILEEETLVDSPEKPTLKQKPKRPTPPRPSKRGKWDEEEEEDGDILGKSGKAGTKTKRRVHIIDDDEEDFDGASDDDNNALSFSLSTARPPKPKSATPAPTTSTTKPKKPPVKVGTTPSRPRAERKERIEEQRPESIVLGRNLTVRELSDLTKVPETDIIKILFFKGIAVNITQTLDLETARQVAEDLEIAVEIPEAQAAATKHTEMLDVADLDNLQHRPPVVTIMGHVDHGKTTLLDSIRQTKVAQGEAGGITQHIGAYHVDVEHNGESQQIVFLDTPGHEAFTAMRARGARVTDIAILVVAADDGVQPQTREAISHAKAAEVPLIVAINKVDKLEANPDRIKQELSELGLVPEEWGGDTIMVPVSALKGENLDHLLEMILLVCELEELSANPDRLAKGTVIEAHLDRARGAVATLLVQNGTLRVGDVIVAGAVMGKIRAMIDDRGEKVEAATPSFAVEILGLNEVPEAGDEFDAFDNEKEARALAEQRSSEKRETRLQKAMSSRRVTLTSLSSLAQEGELKELNLVLKADVQGSVEAILGALEQLPQNEVQIRVLLAAPGEISETDVDLAAASGAVIIGFSTTLASGARAAADREGVDIREYDIIYKLLDDIEGAMEGLLDPEEVESPLGQAEVRAVFPVGRGAVAGCYVQSGKLVRNRLMRVRRNGTVIFEGVMDSLKRIKEDAREVNAGYECGIGSAKFNDWEEGDIIEAYEMVMKRRTLAGK